jgi:hypothetical protein
MWAMVKAKKQAGSAGSLFYIVLRTVNYLSRHSTLRLGPNVILAQLNAVPIRFVSKLKDGQWSFRQRK